MLKARLLPISFLFLAACQSNGDSRVVSGRLDTSQFALMKGGAEVVAAAVSGRTHRAPIRSDGSFELELLVDERYQLRFANITDTEGVFDAFAVLSVDGGTRHTFQVMAGPAFDLGRVGRVGTVSSSLRAFTGGHDDEDDEEDGDDEDGDTDTDGDTEDDVDSTDGDSDSTDSDSDSDDGDSDQDDDDVDEVCDVEGGMDMEDVEAENDPADGMCACSDDSDSEGDSDADDADTDGDGDSDSDSDSDSDTDSSGSDDDTDDDEDSCGSDDHDEDLDDECEEPAPPPDGGENNPIPCTTNEDCPGGVCTDGACVGV